MGSKSKLLSKTDKLVTCVIQVWIVCVMLCINSYIMWELCTVKPVKTEHQYCIRNGPGLALKNKETRRKLWFTEFSGWDGGVSLDRLHMFCMDVLPEIGYLIALCTGQIIYNIYFTMLTGLSQMIWLLMNTNQSPHVVQCHQTAYTNLHCSKRQLSVSPR